MKKETPREALLVANGQTRTACAVLSFNWSPLFNSWSISGDSHHQDPVMSLMLTSSRIDSHRAQQYLDFCFNSGRELQCYFINKLKSACLELLSEQFLIPKFSKMLFMFTSHRNGETFMYIIRALQHPSFLI